MTKTYFAITLGPVYKTIRKARSTREVWAASYLFSILMRELVHAMNGTLLSPSQLDKSTHRFGAGIYPDRAFWELDEGWDPDGFSVQLKAAYKTLEDVTGIKSDVFDRYFRVYGVRKTWQASDPANRILELNRMLDNLEVQEKIVNDPPDIIGELVANIQRLYTDGHKHSGTDQEIFITYTAKGKNRIRLPSILEIATSDLKWANIQTSYSDLVTLPINDHVSNLIRTDEREARNLQEEMKNQDQVLATLRKSCRKKLFRFRHKYVAFGKADGDGMGDAIRVIGNQKETLQLFSSKLSRFAGSAAECVSEFGGIPIYAGGDDLLFILPVVNGNPKTAAKAGANAFQLLKRIDQYFKKAELSSLTGPAVAPTLSFGLSFSYYKYPMDEALADTDKALNLAKSFPGKNTICFRVRKHAGQMFTSLLPKDTAWEKFLEMLDTFNQFSDDAFLSSFMHNLEELEPLLSDALVNNRLEYFFRNQYNESHHQTTYNKFLSSARDLAAKIYANYRTVYSVPGQQYFNSEEAIISSAIRSLHGALRFIQFVNQPDHE